MPSWTWGGDIINYPTRVRQIMADQGKRLPKAYQPLIFPRREACGAGARPMDLREQADAERRESAQAVRGCSAVSRQ
ncbi:hypothetical protein GCM10023080_038840 [Streptomyces pseudoechinosporeus]